MQTSKGAKVNAINKAGCTPLFYAAQQSHLAVAKFLLEVYISVASHLFGS